MKFWQFEATFEETKTTYSCDNIINCHTGKLIKKYKNNIKTH